MPPVPANVNSVVVTANPTGPRGPGAGTIQGTNLFTEFANAKIPVIAVRAFTTGWSVAGVGAANYKRTTATGATRFRAVDAYGYWWEINEYQIFAEMAGAIGDGVTDDAPAINAALLYTPRVWLQNKTYGIASPINLNRGNTLSGNDFTFDDQTGNGSKLYLLSGSNCKMITTPASRQVASFTGVITIVGPDTFLDVSAVASGAIEVNGMLFGAGMSNGQRIAAFVSGTLGGVGRYKLQNPETLTSRPMTSHGAPTEYQGLDHLMIDGNSDGQTVHNIAVDWQGLFVGSWINNVFGKNTLGPVFNFERCDLIIGHVWVLKAVCITGNPISNYAVVFNWGNTSSRQCLINADHFFVENTLNKRGGNRDIVADRGYACDFNRVSLLRMGLYNTEGCITGGDFTSCGVVRIAASDCTAMGNNAVADAAFYRFMDDKTQQFASGPINQQACESNFFAYRKATLVTSPYIPDDQFNANNFHPGYEFNNDPASSSKWYGRGIFANELDIGRVGSAPYTGMKFYCNSDDKTEWAYERSFGGGIFEIGSNKSQPAFSGVAASVVGNVVTVDTSSDLTFLTKPWHWSNGDPFRIVIANATNNNGNFQVVSVDDNAKTITVDVAPNLSSSPSAWSINNGERISVPFFRPQAFIVDAGDHIEAVQPLINAFRYTTNNVADRGEVVTSANPDGTGTQAKHINLNGADNVYALVQKIVGEPTRAPNFFGEIVGSPITTLPGVFWIANGVGGVSAWQLLSQPRVAGTTGQRPVLTNVSENFLYYDTTLNAGGKPIWFKGIVATVQTWVDATGATV